MTIYYLHLPDQEAWVFLFHWLEHPFPLHPGVQQFEPSKNKYCAWKKHLLINTSSSKTVTKTELFFLF